MDTEELDRIELTKSEAFKELYPFAMRCFRQQIRNCDNDVEDLASEVMITLLNEKWDELDSHTLRGLRVWTYRAVRFKALDYIKRKSAQPLPESIEYAMEHNPELKYELFSADASEDENANELLNYIRNLLPPKDYQHFVLRLHDHSPPEIAKALHISEAAERTKYHRIRKILQIEFKKRFQ